MYLLGYDIGSSTIKAALVDAQTQQLVKIVQYPEREMDMISRQSGWAEQLPEVWWQDLCLATKKLLAQSQVEPKEIRAIGIGYQMHGLVLIDKDQRVLRPSIIWCDSRAVEIGNQAYQTIGADYCLNNLLNAPGNFTASKLKWVKDNELETFHQIHKVLLPGDYIAMRLTGKVATTIPGLSEGIFWDFSERRISTEVLDFFEFDPSLLADQVPTFSIQGRLTREAAMQTGLAVGTPVTYRAGDQPNNALALNVLSPGELAATSGTSGVIYGIVDTLMADKSNRVNTFAHVNYEEHFNRLGVLLCLNGAGTTYAWMKHQIARSGRSYQDMERMLASVPVGVDGLCILPFGNGAERIFDNKNIHAHILNLEFNRHTRGHVYRAAIEGVAFSFVYGMNMLKEMGLETDIIRVANDNMFQSRTFTETIATLINSQIEVVNTTGAIGAARAAGVKGRQYKSIEEALSGKQPSTIYEPQSNRAMYSQAYYYWISNLTNQQQGATSNELTFNKLKNKHHQLEEEMVLRNKQLQQQALQLLTKSEVLKELKQSLIALKGKEADESIVQGLIQKIDNHIQTQQEWAVFEANYDLLNKGFCKRLKRNFKHLSLIDIQLALLLKNRLATKEIAHQLNLSKRGVETRRYRLRQKMGLPKGTNIVEFLEQF